MPMVTRTQITDELPLNALWSRPELAATVTAHFSGTAPVNLRDLVVAWETDVEPYLYYCAVVASYLAAETAGGSLMDPKRKLQELAAIIPP